MMIVKHQIDILKQALEDQSREAVTSYRKCLEEVRIISGQQQREQEVINENFENQIERIYNQIGDSEMFRSRDR